MRSALETAVFRLQDRKEAITNELPTGGACAIADDQVRQFISGYDLDFNETMSVALISSDKIVDVIASGAVGPNQAFVGLWLDALMTGLMLADVRAEQAAAERAATEATEP